MSSGGILEGGGAGFSLLYFDGELRGDGVIDVGGLNGGAGGGGAGRARLYDMLPHCCLYCSMGDSIRSRHCH